jgi:hypothetical protein
MIATIATIKSFYFFPKVSVTEKVEINAAKSSFDDDEVNFEEAVVVVEATDNGEEDWAAKSGGWEATNDEAPDENWASWTESQTYKRQPSKDSQQQVGQKKMFRYSHT